MVGKSTDVCMCETRLVQRVSILSAGFGLLCGVEGRSSTRRPQLPWGPPYTLHTTYVGAGVSVVELWGEGHEHPAFLSEASPTWARTCFSF